MTYEVEPDARGITHLWGALWVPNSNGTWYGCAYGNHFGRRVIKRHDKLPTCLWCLGTLFMARSQ